jgi:hypothetical protein
MQRQFVNRSAVRQSFTRAVTQTRTRWSLNQLYQTTKQHEGKSLPGGIAYIISVIPEKPAETEELVDYFQTTYVTATYRPVQRNGEQRLTMRRVPPMFPPSICSVPPATVDSDPRTNNVCEGWNNKFFTLIGSAHPSISI